MIKTLIADDSPTVCAIVSEILRTDGRFMVLANASNGKEAVQLNKELKPDLVVMDLNMPIMNGIQATKLIMEDTAPAVVAFSSEDAAMVGYECIEAGALEMIPKPEFIGLDESFIKEFCNRLFMIAEMHKKNYPELKSVSQKEQVEKYDILLVGASTGGPSAVQKLLSGLKKDFPLPILVTQHIDSFFDVQFAKWLNSTTGLPVELAKDKTVPLPGHVYISPANKHLTVKKTSAAGNKIILSLNDDPPLHFLKPAVDKMFMSALEVYGGRILAVLLTGMGRDGADGCVQIVKAGGYTVAESEESCVVFGMPKAAIEAGGAKSVLPLSDIPDFLRSKAIKQAGI